MAQGVADRLGEGRILVFGDVMLDRYTWGEVAKDIAEAPVPVLKVRERSDAAGGAGNVAVNLAGLGCSVTLVGFAGSDHTGERLRQVLGEAGVVHHLLSSPSRPTITKTRIMAQNQQLLRIDEEDPSACSYEDRQAVLALLENNLPGHSALVLSDYEKGALCDFDFVQRAIELGHRHSIPVLVDPKGRDWTRYRGATCVTPNTAELEAMAGRIDRNSENELIEAAKRIGETFEFEWVLVTRGKRGMCLTGRNAAPVTIPARAREVFDVSGAGDTVIATVAAGLAAGLAMTEAAQIANVAAGIVVGKVGTQPVTHNELAAALQLGVECSHAGGKIAAVGAAQMMVKAWRSSGQRVVFTNGCFDLLHPGHIHLLHRARSLGDRLIVGLNTDLSVKRLKGPLRPILSEQDRATLLAALSCVDMVVLFDEDTPLFLIKHLRPDILVKGDDYRIEQVVGRQEVEEYGGRVELVPVLKGQSTTSIVDRLTCANQKAD